MKSEREHRLVWSDEFSYCAHPHGVKLAGGDLLVVFNRAPRRRYILHPPQDPYFENVVTRSSDGGMTWTIPTVVPDYGCGGAECASLTELREGTVLLNQWRFRWHPLPLAQRLATGSAIFPREWVTALAASIELESGATLKGDPESLVPWARDGGTTFAHISDDGGRTFLRTVEIDVRPYSGGYGMRGLAQLAAGTLVLPLSDVPHYERVFVVHSHDGGLTWMAPVAAADAPGREFEEPSPLVLPSERVLLALRDNRSRSIMMTYSDDGGYTWSSPEETGIDGYPAHLLQLNDGRLLCTYGFRKPPFAIRAVLSEDDGRTWALNRVITIRDRLPNKDLGYPVTIDFGDGRLATIYYAQDDRGVTGIWVTFFVYADLMA